MLAEVAALKQFAELECAQDGFALHHEASVGNRHVAALDSVALNILIGGGKNAWLQ
jgi:hypothetical protein